MLAMLADAVIGHALLWQNDPYWTYWVTDTFLITTVFAIGTALLGIGVVRGAVITAVQMLVLTTYYWSLSPIGLPADAEWLDLQHTWVSGPPVHFGVYYLGYLTSLWLWRHRAAQNGPAPAPAQGVELQHELRDGAVAALVTAAVIVVLVGVAQTLILGQFPGLTWFVMRTVVLVPFTLGWRALAGRDRSAAVAGGLVAAFVLAAYGHYLGPVGLPNANLRILAQDPPPADVHWLTYTEEFLIMGPILVLVAVVAFVTLSQGWRRRWAPLRLGGRHIASVALAAGAIVAAGLVAASENEDADSTVTVTSVGVAGVTGGRGDETGLVLADGDMRFVASQANTRRTPLPPHDDVALTANVNHPNGIVYQVTVSDPIINDARGRFSTWGGVGFDVWHHGRSGIGARGPGAIRSEVATFGLADLRADGELVAVGVPVQAMTVAGGGVELLVGDPASSVPFLPDGHLRAVWGEREGHSPEGPERSRHLLGAVVLLALLAAAVTGARHESRTTAKRT
jgi:hypothetical protein